MVFYLNEHGYCKEISSTDEITLAVKYLLAHVKHEFLNVADPEFHFVTDTACKISK